MTPRERHASGTEGPGGSAAAPRLAPGPAAPRPAPGPAPKAPAAPPWETLYQNAPPAQQQELLSLAARQGLLYAHQLPALPNGSRPAFPAETATRALLPRLLAGHCTDLEPAPVRTIAFHDTALDAAQREAVARALFTPDVCLIQGLPGTGKSRVVSEVVTQAAARGLRVLLLAPSAAAIDRVLETAGAHEAVCALRCLAKDETPESLPAASRALTFREQVRRLAEKALQEARAALERDEDHLRRCRQAGPAWDRLDELAAREKDLRAQVEQIGRQRAACPDGVEAEARAAEGTPDAPGALATEVRARHTALQETRARLEAEQAEAGRAAGERRQELAARQAEIEALGPLARAKEAGRWWTGAWWRATFRGGVRARLAELENQQRETAAALAALEETRQRLAREGDAAQGAYQAERARLVDAEVARRRTELDDREKAARRDQDALRARWQEACGSLDTHVRPPDAPTAEAVAAGRAAWWRHLEQEEQRLTLTREWAGYLAGSAATLAERLPGYVNLVAATTAGLAGDEHFGDQAALGTDFDLLILEEADLVTESEFLRLARRARRWVLVGEPAERPRHPARDRRPHDSRSGALGPSAFFFHRLWEHLHCDPRRLPYTWVRENDNLCCRLRPVGADQRAWLESERVADFPEIELRILVLPRTQPLLAEVVFPPSLAIPQAKEYIFRELQELPVQAPGPSLRWVEEPDQLVLQLAGPGTDAGTWVNLEPGVRELVARREPAPAAGPKESRDLGAVVIEDVPWHTARLAFDRTAGWDRPRAEEWVRRHLGLCDLGRAVRLEVPRRMRPALAAFLAPLFEAEDVVAPVETGREPAEACANGCTCAVEFVPVPSLAATTGPRRRPEAGPRAHANGARVAAPPAPLTRAPRGGAGLELDLAAPRHVDRLPTELRAELPRRGFVNYLEAQAVVRKLEALAADPALRAAGPPARPDVAVLALYPAQAELIRRLLRQRPALADGALAVEIDVPGAFRQREAAVVLLSLTRSHTHRAVSFGEEPQALLQALTRARSRLVLFGDPGTLARRGQWEGPLDHLDEIAAGRERRIVCHLLHYLQGHGRHPEVFHLAEGSGA